MLHRYVIPYLVFFIYSALRFTWRVNLREPEELKQRLKNREPFILTHWHGDELALYQFIGYYRVGTIVSTSKDGEIMNTMVRLIGGHTSRGSSTRGGVGALKGLLRLVREGWNCSFAVDGPKGPIYKVKPGVFEVARAMQVPMFWVGVSCNRAFHFPKSWNKTYLPKPFARIEVQWHGSMMVPRDADPKSSELALDLETKLNAAKQQAALAFVPLAK